MFSGSKGIVLFKILIAITLGAMSIYGALMFLFNLFMHTQVSVLMIGAFIMSLMAIIFYVAYEKNKNKNNLNKSVHSS